MRTRPRPDAPQLAPLVLVALAALVLGLGVADLRASGDQAVTRAADLPASAWNGLVGGPKVRASVGQRVLVLLRVPSLAQRVERAGGRATEQQQRRWTTAVMAAQGQAIAELAARGVRVEPEFEYARVLAGFSAALDARSIAEVERAPGVLGVYPVRATYPAAAETGRSGGGTTAVRLPGATGRGITVALLDTGVDRTHPFVRSRVAAGFDIVGGTGPADAGAQPGDPRDLERHGTQLAGLIAGSGGPAGITGVAPGARVLPVRVAGWQRDADGAWTVYGRTDQLIAGLERAVDPNGDGDAHDAARVAVLGVVSPYAAFTDGPEAQAVRGAEQLDTLVVAPAGNDGPGGPRFGSIAGPGGTPFALTVGAAEPHASGRIAAVSLRTGLEVAFDGLVPLAGEAPPERVTLPLALPRPLNDSSGRPRQDLVLGDFFDARGHSLVAARAALVRAGTTPQRAARAALDAGAAAVVLYGGRLPAGALDLGGAPAVPVVGVPEPAGLALAARLRKGGRGTVSIAARGETAVGGGVAPFSSRGLAFDGGLKPDLVAPGVALRSADAGETESAQPRYGAISGASAAAAVTGAAAALLAQARPDLDAAALRGALAGSAQPLPNEPRTTQGAGLLDLGAAATMEVVSHPATLAFPQRSTGSWVGRRSFRIRNVSSRVVRLRLRAALDAGSPEVSIRLRPSAFRLRPGRSGRVTVVARGRATDETAAGTVLAEIAGRPVLSVPWAAPPAVPEQSLLSSVALANTRFRPSDTAPSVLTFAAGRLVRAREGFHVQAVSRLDLVLRRPGSTEELGVLARLRHLLPGQYAFGLTGRGPGGKALEPGRYELRLEAYPTGSGPPTRRTVRFTVTGA